MNKVAWSMPEVPDCSTPNKKKKYIESQMRRTREAVEEIRTGAETYLTGPYGTRRKEALLHYMDRAEEEFGQLGFVSVVESFTKLELRPYNYYDTLDIECDLRIGAALWILDRLKENERMPEAYSFLPDVSGDPNAWYLPIDFAHPCYTDDLIHSVIHVISNRYGGQHEDAVITEGNARRKKPGETYRQLLALLPEGDVEHACEEFRNKIWELASRAMKGESYYERELERLTREIERADKATLPGPYANPPQSDPMRENKTHEFAMRGKELLDRSRDFSLDFGQYLWMDRRTLRRLTRNREVAEAVEGFTVRDPYELCFALFYLMDTGDDAPWLMHSGASLMLYAQRMLPWYESSDECDEEWEGWYDGIQYNRNGWVEQDDVEDEIDYYHERHGERNLAQVIYDLCKTVVPAGLHPFREDRKRLITEGMEEDTARKITDTAELLFLYQFQSRQWLEDDYSHSMDEENGDGEHAPDEESGTKQDAPVPKLGGYWGKVMEQTASGEGSASETSGGESSVDVDKLQSELGEARKLIKSLRNALAVTKQEAGTERAKYERELKALRMEHRELADLQELVFNREAEEQDIQIRLEKPAVQIDYPYTVKKRTVIFGGHESWLKVIRPMLPGVKFVDVEQYTFSPELIRNADVVWVQSNCISHTQYGRVIKQTRMHGIQLRYFAHGSAEKCAEQLVMEDRKD